MINEEQLLSGLNPAQREAVEYCDGPELIIAGAGSGKTRVLTYKIAYLLQRGLKPWNILALTFTNKAANEMKERIAQLVGEEQASGLQMGTFHSIFSRILRAQADRIGYSHAYTIYDENDSRSLLKKVIRDMGLDDKTYKPATVHGVISKAKNRLYMPDDYVNSFEQLQADRQRNMPELGKIYMAYNQRLRQANCMDFDDLQVLTYRLFVENEDVRRFYSDRFAFVLVDEYQDTNMVQRKIMEQLTQERRKICVVGDDYQSIYAFRGANIDNILLFRKIYEDARLFKLEQNYRSTQSIVLAANSLMKHNGNQIPKELYSKNEEGDQITVLENISDKREAETVCREIKRLKKEEDCAWKDFAILYRTNAQSRLFEEEMRKPSVGLGDKYRIFGGLSFYQRKEIKDVIAYFRLVVNPRDEEAFYRVVNYPSRGIGNTTLQRLAQASRDTGVGVWELLEHPDPSVLPLNRGTMGKLIAFRDLIQGFIDRRQLDDASVLARDIVTKSGIATDLSSDRTPEGESRRENVDELFSGIANFVQTQQEDGDPEHTHIEDYLSTVSLMTDIDDGDDSDDKISLMTIHAAKGLEFKTVFVVGMEENMFPSQMAVSTQRELEEERRLCYVAITRAEKHCYLSWAHQRWRFGSPDMMVRPSRFLKDIEPQYLHIVKDGGKRPVRHGGGLEDGWNDEPVERPFRRPWEEDRQPSWRQRDYESDRPYTGSHPWGSEYRQLDSRMQNSRPVAGQFMADPKPKITSPRQPEEAVNPFGKGFERRLQQSGNWQKVAKAMTNGGRSTGVSSSPRPAGMRRMTESERTGSRGAAQTTGPNGLKVGSIIEHQRFGRGTVMKIEGTGENCKASICFDESGTKQLLLKFARFTIVG